jgi:hypothetical protein
MTLSPDVTQDQFSLALTTRYRLPVFVGQICSFNWDKIECEELLKIAHVYYYFSIQFRENLEIACALFPGDGRLRLLHEEECETDNLSPWPGIAAIGEKLDHDEFMRRALRLDPRAGSCGLDRIGARYLREIRSLSPLSRAKSIASYENGGLFRVFSAMLRAPDWRGPALRAFKFFLERHIEFDADESGGHGALTRCLEPDDSILPLWSAFHGLLRAAAPGIAPAGAGSFRA